MGKEVMKIELEEKIYKQADRELNEYIKKKLALQEGAFSTLSLKINVDQFLKKVKEHKERESAKENDFSLADVMVCAGECVFNKLKHDNRIEFRDRFLEYVFQKMDRSLQNICKSDI